MQRLEQMHVPHEIEEITLRDVCGDDPEVIDPHLLEEGVLLRVGELAWTRRIVDTLNLWTGEDDYAEAEHRLWDSTRCDIVTPDSAVECEWPVRWAESVGQSTWYSTLLQKNPVVCLLVGSWDREKKYVYRLQTVCATLNIGVWICDIRRDELRLGSTLVPLTEWNTEASVLRFEE